MSRYLSAAGIQKLLTAQVMPPAWQVAQAQRTLAQAPVSNYVGFTPVEVQALAAYRCQFPLGVQDICWQAIVQGKPEAWLYAVHEAAEIEALVAAGANPLDRAALQSHLPEAHLRACVAETRFLRAWAMDLGYNTTEMALESENPIRGQFSEHRRFFLRFQEFTNGPTPSAEQEQQAAAFFQRILR